MDTRGGPDVLDGFAAQVQGDIHEHHQPEDDTEEGGASPIDGLKEGGETQVR